MENEWKSSTRQTKVKLKNLYLIAIIAIGLIGLGVGSTFAMFTAQANIDNPIAFESDLSSINFLSEVVEVTVPAYSDKIVDLIISNSSEDSLYYSAWYSSVSPVAEVGSTTSNNSYGPTGLLPTETNFTLTNTLRNRTSSPIVVTLGVTSAPSNSVTIPNGVTLITLGTLPPLINENAATYITNLYANGEKSTVTNNTTSYRRVTSARLMNDKNGELGSGVDLDSGNIRYYGKSNEVNNYVYFNCTDYLYQGDNTCELWRIIGVFDGKLKLIRSTSIGNMSWDTSESTSNSGKGSSDWTQSDLMKILNPGYETNSIIVNGDDVLVNNSLYWNRTGGTVNYFSGQNNAYTTLSDPSTMFYDTGITTATKTKNLIEDSTWYVGRVGWILGTNSLSPATTYKDEREEGTWTGKVGVMYPSDYAYATDFSYCNRYITNYDNSDDSYGCRSNDWLYSGVDEWTFSPVKVSLTTVSVECITAAGKVDPDDMYTSKAVRPVVFIDADEYFWIGEGTAANPYRIR